jgi:cytochrome c556
MRRTLALAALLSVAATVVFAQNLDAIKQRQEAMKAQETAGGQIADMLKGKAPFDLAKAKASFAVFTDTTAKLKTLFPDDSKTGGDTAALPVIWEQKADFMARLDKLGADAKAASAAITDEASLKREAGKVFSACTGCHKVYQKP